MIRLKSKLDHFIPVFQTLQWLPFSLRVKSKSLNDLQSPSQSGPLRLWPSRLLISPSSSLTLPQLYWPLCWPSYRPEIILSQSLSTSEYSCLLLTEHSSPDICMSLSHLLQHVLYQQILKDFFLTLLFHPTSTLSILFLCSIFLHSIPCHQMTNYYWFVYCLSPLH